MYIYELEVMAVGSCVVIDKRDLSGCHDRVDDCWQEATFVVAAKSIKDAVELIYKEYEKLNRDYANTCDSIWYNPNPLSVGEDEDETEEIVEYYFDKPRIGDGIKEAPNRYCVSLK